MEIVQDKWKEILQRVRDEQELSEISFTTWIEPLTIHSVEDNLITILVPSEKMGLDYVSKKYTLPIKVAIAEITGVNYEIRFILPEEVKQEKAPAPVQKNLYVPNLNPKYTLIPSWSAAITNLPMQLLSPWPNPREKSTIRCFYTVVLDWAKPI